MPLWVGLVILFIAFRFVVWPLRAARQAYYFSLGRWSGHRGLGCGTGDSWLWVGILAVGVWFADRHVPAVHTALENLPANVDHAVASLRDWWTKR
jgi:hypothetical protein